MAAAYLGFLVLQAAVLVPTYLVVRPAAGSIVNGLVATIGLLCMIAMHVYSIARRNARLRRWMRLSWWLHLHIYLGLQGILLTYLHAMPLFWRHGPPILVNPAMLNLYALTVVFASGLFGRYLYARIPKTVAGLPWTQGAKRTTSQRLFGTWIHVHRPIAAAMYLVTAVHVLLGVLFNSWSEWL
ncbi:MAG: hypothetical protein AAF211_01420 [Myxococcota bacterium]